MEKRRVSKKIPKECEIVCILKELMLVILLNVLVQA